MFTYLLIVVFFCLSSNVKQTMAPHEFVEIRLVCKADYLDPQLKLKLHEIKDKLKEILDTGKIKTKKANVRIRFIVDFFRSQKICIKKSAAVE